MNIFLLITGISWVQPSFILRIGWELLKFFLGDIWWDYGDAIAELVKSGSLGIVDPQMNPIVVCGHSGGAVGAYVKIRICFHQFPYSWCL